MGFLSWKTRTAAILSAAAAAALIGTTPAHAYKLDDGKLEIKGLAFLDWTQVDTGDNNDTTGASDDAASGFHYERAYFEMRYHPEEKTTYRLTLDSKNATDDVFVKYAYVDIQYAGDNSHHVKFGQNHTPVVDYYQTKIWAHRYVAKTFVDDIGALTSADLGISFYGDFADKRFTYYVSLMNGEGYNNTPDGAGYSLAGRVEGTFGPAKVGAHAHTETDRAGTDGYDPTREGVYVNMSGDWGNAAAEYLMADDGNATTFDDGTGYSALVNVKIPAGNKSTGFVRYDSMEFKDSDPDPVTQVIVGAETEVNKNVMVAATFKQTDPGGSADTEDVFGLFAQFKI